MRTVLHIKAATTDALAEAVISAHLNDPSLRVEIVDLKVDEPDYQIALEGVFTADSVAVW